MKYSKLIGLKKTIKNLAITWDIPAIALLANNYVEWVPKEYQYYVGLLIAGGSYFYKNRLENK